MADRAYQPRTLAITLPEPPSANRWWRNVNGHMVTSAVAREYKDDTVVRECVKQMGRGWKHAKVEKPAEVRVVIDWYRARRAGDLDKRLGVLLDALQGIAYESDAQIVHLTARRFDDAERPRVEVEVYRVGSEARSA